MGWYMEVVFCLQDEVASTTATDAPLDLSGEPSKRPTPPTESEVPHSVLKDYAANAVKEFLAMYGFNDAAEGILKHLPNTPITPGKCPRSNRNVTSPSVCCCARALYDDASAS